MLALNAIEIISHKNEDNGGHANIPHFPRCHQVVQTYFHLTRLDLFACRIEHADFRNAMAFCRLLLKELRIQMVFIVPEPVPNAMELVINMEAMERFDLSPCNSLVFNQLRFPNLKRLGSHKKMLEDRCLNCTSPRPSSKCGQCRFYAFCHRDCQLFNWNLPNGGHKRVCQAPENASISFLVTEYLGVRELDLAHYWQPTMLQSLFTLPMCERLCVHLVSLRLVRCGIRDEDVELVCKHASHLKRVDLSLNTKLTIRCLTQLPSTMVDVRLRQNHRINDSNWLAETLSRFSRLEVLDLRCGLKKTQRNSLREVGTTSTNTLLLLSRSCPHLKVLRVILPVNVILPPSLLQSIQRDENLGLETNGEDWGEIL